VGPGPLLLPMPVTVSSEPCIADLRTLIEIKLSSYLGSPVSRIQDMADVVALIRANAIPRSFALDASVQEKYWGTWDALESEKSR
jgi:hypothetical protein